MTDTDMTNRLVLRLLRRVREEDQRNGLRGVDLYLVIPGLMDPGLMRDLESRGLITRRGGTGGWTTSSEADRLLDRIDEVGLELLAEFEPCPYDFAHTRHWCGHQFCRDS